MYKSRRELCIILDMIVMKVLELKANQLLALLVLLLVSPSYVVLAQDLDGETLILGADVSFLDQLEQAGVDYRESGVSKELLDILRDNGMNTIRLRLWHTPGSGWNSLERTLAIARRVQSANLDLLLDFHFSDTWADPGKQTKPQAWDDLEFELLVDSVRVYTRDAMAAFNEQGIVPAFVQVGNEISTGMLWDDGRVGGSFDTPAQWEKLATLLNAAIDGIREVFPIGSEAPAIILHTDHGGNLAAASWFFGHIEEENVPYDIIGLSYYSFWHGSLEDLKRTLDGLENQFNKPMLLVETAYPWTLGWFDNVNNIIGLPEHVLPGYAASPDGQFRFLSEVIDIIKGVPSSKGIGLIYWAPEYIAVPGVGSPWENMTLFDENGNALPGLLAFNEEQQSVGVQENSVERQFEPLMSIYPNPFTETLSLDFESPESSILSFNMYSVLGVELVQYQGPFFVGRNTVQINVPDIPPGLYVYRGFLGSTPFSGILIKKTR